MTLFSQKKNEKTFETVKHSVGNSLTQQIGAIFGSTTTVVLLLLEILVGFEVKRLFLTTLKEVAQVYQVESVQNHLD